MSKTTLALEAAVAAVIANTPAGDAGPTARQRATIDKAFARIMNLIAPRVRHFIRQYGLVAHWDDAEQACAIAVHRAIQAYDPEKAQFTTFVNWQIRGELQGLRFRVMTDQRPSAKKVDATTVSINAITFGADGEEATLESVIEDEDALALTEAGASAYLAAGAMGELVDAYIEHLRKVAIAQLRRRPRPKTLAAPAVDANGRPVPRLRTGVHGIDPEELEKLDQRLKRNREIVERRLFDMAGAPVVDEEAGITKERVRQITKRAAKTIADLAGSDPRFALMADYRVPGPIHARRDKAKADAASMRVCPPSASLH